MKDATARAGNYVLDDQIGFILRRANQRHLALFAAGIPELTPTQFAALSKLCQLGRVSQNALGRATAMDASTIKGVVDRLRGKGLVVSQSDPDDQRRIYLSPSTEGRELFKRLAPRAAEISRDTLAPLAPADRDILLKLLARLA